MYLGTEIAPTLIYLYIRLQECFEISKIRGQLTNSMLRFHRVFKIFHRISEYFVVGIYFISINDNYSVERLSKYLQIKKHLKSFTTKKCCTEKSIETIHLLKTITSMVDIVSTCFLFFVVSEPFT